MYIDTKARMDCKYCGKNISVSSQHYHINKSKQCKIAQVKHNDYKKTIKEELLQNLITELLEVSSYNYKKNKLFRMEDLKTFIEDKQLLKKVVTKTSVGGTSPHLHSPIKEVVGNFDNITTN